ncbi:hypothetical protein HDU76_014001 [Blyttiomyces sp. JEL0837]|nr:hypothetical protein HDU76_014001 [Blyttiomyces sp. JEL0837]
MFGPRHPPQLSILVDSTEQQPTATTTSTTTTTNASSYVGTDAAASASTEPMSAMVIKGRVLMKLSKMISDAVAIELLFTGKIQLSTQEIITSSINKDKNASPTTTKGSSNSDTDTDTLEFAKTRSVVTVRTIVWASSIVTSDTKTPMGTTLNAGRHSYPFVLQIPGYDTLPPSHQSKFVKIEYNLVARLLRTSTMASAPSNSSLSGTVSLDAGLGDHAIAIRPIAISRKRRQTDATGTAASSTSKSKSKSLLSLPSFTTSSSKGEKAKEKGDGGVVIPSGPPKAKHHGAGIKVNSLFKYQLTMPKEAYLENGKVKLILQIQPNSPADVVGNLVLVTCWIDEERIYRLVKELGNNKVEIGAEGGKQGRGQERFLVLPTLNEVAGDLFNVDDILSSVVATAAEGDSVDTYSQEVEGDDTDRGNVVSTGSLRRNVNRRISGLFSRRSKSASRVSITTTATTTGTTSVSTLSAISTSMSTSPMPSEGSRSSMDSTNPNSPSASSPIQPTQRILNRLSVNTTDFDRRGFSDVIVSSLLTKSSLDVVHESNGTKTSIVGSSVVTLVESTGHIHVEEYFHREAVCVESEYPLLAGWKTAVQYAQAQKQGQSVENKSVVVVKAIDVVNGDDNAAAASGTVRSSPVVTGSSGIGKNRAKTPQLLVTPINTQAPGLPSPTQQQPPASAPTPTIEEILASPIWDEDLSSITYLKPRFVQDEGNNKSNGNASGEAGSVKTKTPVPPLRSRAATTSFATSPHTTTFTDSINNIPPPVPPKDSSLRNRAGSMHPSTSAATSPNGVVAASNSQSKAVESGSIMSTDTSTPSNISPVTPPQPPPLVTPSETLAAEHLFIMSFNLPLSNQSNGSNVPVPVPDFDTADLSVSHMLRFRIVYMPSEDGVKKFKQLNEDEGVGELSGLVRKVGEACGVVVGEDWIEVPLVVLASA